jgi:hypothetical protein
VAASISLAIAATLPLSASAGLTSPYVRKSLVRLAPGITWEKGVARTANGIQAVQIGRIDVHEASVQVRALLSNDRVINLERPSENADRHSAPGALAMIATNGDVSTVGDLGAGAAPPTMHVDQGELMVGQICGRPTLGIMADGTARIAFVKNDITLDITSRVPGWRGLVYVHDLNRASAAGRVAIFTDVFGPSTLTTFSGIAVEVDPSGEIGPNGRTAGTVVAIQNGVSDVAIPKGHVMVVGSGNRAEPLKALQVGDRLAVVTDIEAATDANRCGDGIPVNGWDSLTGAVGGNYFTARDGVNVAPTSAQYAKGGVAAPRTNVGITADGDILMVVVDGRQAGYSIGMNLIEMGDLMLSLGAVSAFNLDGGGSTIMAVRKPATPDHITVSDRPSDGRERALTQALTVFSITDPAK